MRRVCRPGGKIIILNHFRSANPVLSRIERAISPFTVHIGFKSDLDLPGFLAQAETAADIDREGEHPADLVAGHLRQIETPAAQARAGDRSAVEAAFLTF